MANEKIQTVVAVFLDDKRLLMEKRTSERKVYANFLMCPSGHVKKGEALEQAFAREMKEELEIIIKKSKFLFSIDDIDPFSKREFTHNFMLVEAYKGKIGTSKEAKMLKWFTYEELENEELVLIVRRLVGRLHEMRVF